MRVAPDPVELLRPQSGLQLVCLHLAPMCPLGSAGRDRTRNLYQYTMCTFTVQSLCCDGGSWEPCSRCLLASATGASTGSVCSHSSPASLPNRRLPWVRPSVGQSGKERRVRASSGPWPWRPLALTTPIGNHSSASRRRIPGPCPARHPLLGAPSRAGRKAVTWLILPVVICLSQRLSHACLSINCFIL